LHGNNSATVNWDAGIAVSNGFNNSRCNLSFLTKYEQDTEQKTEESELPEYRKRLLAIYENMAHTDFTIICKAEGEEHKFPCHKVIIASGSGYFAHMLEAGMTESSSGEVEVQGYEPDEVALLVKSLYIPKIEKEVLDKNPIKLLKMADQYDVPKLKADVVKLLKSKITKDSVLDVVLSADSYNASDLKTAAIEFIVRNKVKKENLEEWKLAMKGREELLFEVFAAVHQD